MDSRDAIIAHYQHRLAAERERWYDEREMLEQYIADLQEEIAHLKMRLTEQD